MCIRDRVVGIEGDDVVNTHIYQLLKCQSAVERFPAGTFVLAALIEERHDDIQAACFSAYCCDDSLQILKMVIW